MGIKDIDFDNCPDFSKSYLLKGNDEGGIRRIFKPEVINYFEQNKTNATIEASKDNLIYYNLGKRVKASELNSFMDEVAKVVRVFDKDDF